MSKASEYARIAPKRPIWPGAGLARTASVNDDGTLTIIAAGLKAVEALSLAQWILAVYTE